MSNIINLKVYSNKAVDNKSIKKAIVNILVILTHLLLMQVVIIKT